MGRIEKQYELVKKQVGKAQKLFEDDDTLPEALQNIFAIFENCANLLKDVKNMTARSKHSDVNYILKDMYIRKLLKQDYSLFHLKLSDYRVKAFFGEYSRIKEPLPPKSSLKIYLTKSIELFNEVKPIVDGYIKGHKK